MLETLEAKVKISYV